ncbi:LysR family transcriptional regulator [Rhodothalassium salexigens DSM 2132]|uniref:LysR family transcriptional regulator n=2 Tax=Rhodothalassium salexigens TaxID=1086 RepID=A0A4R2PQW4_RHOSA|nr:transcriptional regulator GcvA [Rhodothalassium salexigens]TCP38209.1 LysR family transcriptional regulator [Rhodothalassium salexigens DSM 2132]
MKRAQLPLNALRAFDAAARHMSFKKAADELAVTPAAVSQQIRSLEDLLGVELFRRTSRSLILTDRAQMALASLRQGFEAIEDAVSTLEAARDDGTLHLSVSPSFASKWLVPRLERYYQQNPNAVVKIDASMEVTDFAETEMDLAIRYGAGQYPGLHAEELMREEVFPVCSPALQDGETPVRTPGDLVNVPLIHDDSSLDDESCPSWAMWLKAAGVTVREGQPALHFNQTSLAIEAAIAGRGVVLAKRTLAHADLRAGRLVRPFRHTQSVGFAYFMVCPRAKKDMPKVETFMNWLRVEAGHDWAYEI